METLRKKGRKKSCVFWLEQTNGTKFYDDLWRKPDIQVKDKKYGILCVFLPGK